MNRRIWFNVPKRGLGHSHVSRYVDRPVDNANITARKFLGKPHGFIGNGHHGWELYYHEAVVQDFVNLLKRWLAATDGSGGPPVPASELLEAIRMYDNV